MGLMAGAALAAGLSADPNVLSFASLPANLTLTQVWGLAPTSGWNHPWRKGVADSRKALVGAAFFTVAVIAAPALQAPDALIVSGFGGLIISLAQASKSGSPRFSHPSFVYFGEIGY
jgi:hypothetical protein